MLWKYFSEIINFINLETHEINDKYPDSRQSPCTLLFQFVYLAVGIKLFGGISTTICNTVWLTQTCNSSHTEIIMAWSHWTSVARWTDTDIHKVLTSSHTDWLLYHASLIWSSVAATCIFEGCLLYNCSSVFYRNKLLSNVWWGIFINFLMDWNSLLFFWWKRTFFSFFFTVLA